MNWPPLQYPAGVILIPLFFIMVAAASGDLGYLGTLLFSTSGAPLGVPFIVWTIVFAFIGPVSWLVAYRIWLYARREVTRTELMIQNVKRMV